MINGKKQDSFTTLTDTGSSEISTISVSDGEDSAKIISVSDESPKTTSIFEDSPKINESSESQNFRNETGTNSTEIIDSNEILADSPLSSDRDSNSTLNSTRSANFSSDLSIFNESNSISNLTSNFFTTAIPQKVIKNEKNEKNSIVSNPLSNSVLKDVFTAFDSDGNELITFFELKSAVDKYRVRLSEADVHQMIKVADLSGEGVVDYNEFTSLMRRAS